MTIDIREDVPHFLDYVKRRVAEHVAKSTTQKDLPPVKMIDFGFEFGQANWVALVFDTRIDAEPDGQWTVEIEEVLFPRANWPIWHELPEDAVVHFLDLAGKKVNVMENPDEIICTIVGDALKHVLLTAREQGIFDPLPKAAGCELAVENIEGFYGWPMYEDRGKENLV